MFGTSSVSSLPDASGAQSIVGSVAVPGLQEPNSLYVLGPSVLPFFGGEFPLLK